MKTTTMTLAATLFVMGPLPASAEPSAAAELVSPEMLASPMRMTPQQMMQRIREMQQLQHQRMQAGRAMMPPPGPRMADPETRRRMQEMHRQRMEMMQSRAPAAPAAALPAPESQVAAAGQASPGAPEQTAAAPGPMPVEGSAVPPVRRPCVKPHAPRDGWQGRPDGRGEGKRNCMKRKMMQMRQQHWQTMEQRLANIEALLQQLVDQQKAR